MSEWIRSTAIACGFPENVRVEFDHEKIDPLIEKTGEEKKTLAGANGESHDSNE